MPNQALPFRQVRGPGWPGHSERLRAVIVIVLPEAYKQFMATYPWPAGQGSTEASLWDDPSAIIEQTQAQRHGYGDAPPWSLPFVVIGDEDNACPYALDCATGQIVQTDHGNLKVQPPAKYSAMAELVTELRAVYDKAARKPWWKFW